MPRFTSILPCPLVQTPAGEVQFVEHVAEVSGKELVDALRDGRDGPLAFLGLTEEQSVRPARKSKAKPDSEGSSLGE